MHPVDAHCTLNATEGRRTAVMAVIAPPPAVVFPMVEVTVLGVVVVKFVPFVWTQPARPVKSVRIIKASFIPAPKLTVYPHKA